MIETPKTTPADLAQHYAACGFPVFPCDPKTKAPLTRHGFKDATRERAAIAAYWAEHPGAMIGMPTGQASGVFALDLDTDDDTGEALGEAWLASAGLGRLLDGPGAMTPSGGRHIYFRADGLGEGLRNTTNKAAGVDTRGDGGYVILPGSAGPAGTYQAVNGGVIDQALPSLPKTLLEALPGKSKAAKPIFNIDTRIEAYPSDLPPADLAEAEEIIGNIPPDCDYGDWVKVLMALHNHFQGSAAALALADHWSARGTKYKPGEVAGKWKGFPGGDFPQGWASVCKLAEAHGADLSAIALRHKRAGATVRTAPEPTTSNEAWPEPDTRFLRPELPAPPVLPLHDVFGPIWARWITGAAEAKSAPPDYIAAALLSVAGAMIGNTRWASPWAGWSEPPIIWAVAIGTPSMNKSPGFDAILGPLRKLEGQARKQSEAAVKEWRDRAEVAKLAEATWKEAAKAALKQGEEPPAKPKEADPGAEPFRPRYVLTDTTVEKLGVILASQSRGALHFRDELTGWLQGMTRYSGGGSDRPFWLESYGGRAFSVERMGREPVHINHLSVGVLGGIQPDRLRSLLFKSDDDGLLARFIPIWPNPAPITRPSAGPDDGFLSQALERLLALQMPMDEDGNPRPWHVPFTPEAADLFQPYRETVREWETGTEGLLLSFIGKLPGLAARLALVLAFLDYAATGREAPEAIGIDAVGRAAHFIETYALPMARRAYADASLPKSERAARRLAAILAEGKMERFTTREILRLERNGLRTQAELDPALALLEEAAIIRRVNVQSGAKGGAPQRLYTVNPASWGKA